MEFVPGVLVAFQDDATVLSNRVLCRRDVTSARLPSQGRTNITQGILTAVRAIASARVPPGTRVLLVFLSDGEHNVGDVLADRHLALMRSQLQNLDVTVVVVGVGSSSNTAVGMKMKTALETVPVPGLDAIYFAPSAGNMHQVLDRMLVGLREHFVSGKALNVSCVSAHSFFSTSALEQAMHVPEDADYVTAVVVGPAEGDDAVPVFCFDAGDPIALQVVPVDPDIVAEAVDAQVPRLAQMGVARGVASISADVAQLRALITACAETVAAAASPPPGSDESTHGFARLRPGQRASALRAFRTSEVAFREQLNRLDALRAGAVNDSAKQAEFLNGMQKGKYAAKAVRRAGTLDKSVADVMAEVNDTLEKLRVELAKQDMVTFPDVKTSMLSLNSPREQLEEWLDLKPAELQDLDLFGVLVAYSMCGYPIHMAATSAAQMCPWQTYCLDISPIMVDSGSVCLANKTNKPIRGPDGQPVRDVLVLAHPQCPALGKLAVNSKVNQYLCSTIICRDLHMGTPGMATSMHAHGMLRSMAKYVSMGSSAYVGLALELAFSVRTVHDGQVYQDLLRHWLVDWATITSAQDDGCKHPVQALLALVVAGPSRARAASAVAAPAPSTSAPRTDWAAVSAPGPGMGVVPMLTLVCEVVARRCRGALKAAAADQDSGTSGLAKKTLAAMYGITAANSPSANTDPFGPELSKDEVRRSCPSAHVLDNSAFPSRLMGDKDGATVHDWVLDVVQPYYHLFRLGHVVQKLRVWSGDVEQERQVPYAQLAAVVAEFNAMPGTFLDFLGIPEADHNHVLETIFAQGLLHHDSGSRKGTAGADTGVISEEDTGAGAGAGAGADEEKEGDVSGLPDVRNATTLHDLLVDVHMEFYAKSCAAKHQMWASMVGDVTMAQARQASLEEFKAMLGSAHTHSMTTKMFWGFVAAAKGDADKTAAFLAKSNNSVPRCFSKLANKQAREAQAAAAAAASV